MKITTRKLDYCTECVHQLKWKYHVTRFDPKSGEPISQGCIICPHARWYNNHAASGSTYTFGAALQLWGHPEGDK